MNTQLFDHDFRSAMSHYSINYNGEIIADGKIHRFHIEDDSSQSRNGWYVFHPDNIPWGVFGNWKTGLSYTWCTKSLAKMSKEESLGYQQIIKDKYHQRIRIKEQEYKDTVVRAQQMWNNAQPANLTHPYLVKKQVSTHNLRQIKNLLLVPLVDVTGNLQNLQIINSNGSKYFLRGGRVHGLFSLLGETPICGRLYISEGWATAATIREITKCTVISAMNAGNIKPVATIIRESLPSEVSLVIAADNDRFTPNNPGLTKGKDAAKSVNAILTWPHFHCEECSCTDFNDLHNCDLKGCNK